MQDRPGSLVGSYAGYLLSHELEALSAELVAAIKASVADYAELAAVGDRDLHESCRSNLEQALLELIDQPPPRDGSTTPQYATGRRRAAQRLPLESLLHSYRLGGRVLWQGLVRRASSLGSAADHRQLLDEAGVVWEVIDRHSSIVSRAYREEQSRLLRHTQRRRGALLAAVLDGNGVDAEVVREAAAVLDMPARGPRFVVLAALEPPSVDPIRSADHALEARGFTSAWITQARRECGLIALRPGQHLQEALAVLEESALGRVAASPIVDGFEQVAACYRLADLTLQTLPADFAGVARVAERLPQILLVSSPEVTGILVEQTLGPVLALRPAERDVLLGTLAELLACDRSYTAAARRLYCHRNTVLKRAHRLEALTGLRLGEPQDLLHLTLAVLAIRIGHQPPARLPTSAATG